MQATAQAQPNIALVKYWGKRDVARNLPAVGSLSITLDSLWTRATVEFGKWPADTLQVNGVESSAMLARVAQCLDLVAGEDRSRAKVSTEANFPIGAGLASSASVFAALAVAANAASGAGQDTLTLARLAGRVSGSSARSLYGGFVELSAGDDDIGLRVLAGPQEWPLAVVVAITDEQSKPVGSSDAMIRSAETSPFYGSFVKQQDADLDTARQAVASRDFAALAGVAEHNCLKMHSVMWTSRPSIVYWNKATIACLEVVRSLQADGRQVFFTMDAGPQVKAVCAEQDAGTVEEALARTSGVRRTLRSCLGVGARLAD
jgi:diphosphomevalonate decarboxylase